jgi:hypothetical protein
MCDHSALVSCSGGVPTAHQTLGGAFFSPSLVLVKLGAGPGGKVPVGRVLGVQRWLRVACALQCTACVLAVCFWL